MSVVKRSLAIPDSYMNNRSYHTYSQLDNTFIFFRESNPRAGVDLMQTHTDWLY